MINEKVKEIKEIFGIKDKFHVNRFNEKKFLINLRHKLTNELIEKRDKVHEKRHKERIEILDRKLG